MRRKIGLFLIFVLLLTGCGKSSDVHSDSVQSQAVEEPENLLPILGGQNLFGEDNTMDEYQYQKRVSLNVACEEDEIECPARWYVCENSITRYQQFFSFERGGRTVVLTTDRDSETVNEFTRDNCPRLDDYLEFGPVLGTDHYVVLEGKEENGKWSYVFSELDDRLETVRQFSVPIFDENKLYSASSLLIDKQGNLHIITQELFEFEDGYMTDMSTERYLVVTEQGEILAELSDHDYYMRELVEIYDDQIAYRRTPSSMDESGALEIMIGVMDVKTGENRILGSREITCERYDGSEQGIHNAITMQDADHMLYTDSNGLYRKNLRTDEVTMLYRWMNHGLSVTNVVELTVVDEGIVVIFDEQNVYSYLYLVPVTEKKDMLSIDFVCSQSTANRYRKLITNFHKHFPSYHIELITDLEESLLRTKLIAGEGPVLIDSGLVGFEEMKKLWMPLDGYLDQMFTTDEIIDQALECGRIDGTLYGAVDSFVLYTVITLDSEINTWDYDEFIQYVRQHPGADNITNNEGTDGAEGAFIMRFFNHGTDDNYFINYEDGSTIFRDKKLGELLDVIEKYYPPEQNVSWGEPLVNGQTLCSFVSVTRPSDLKAHRMIFGDKINYIGYPHVNGSGSYLFGGAPICIRDNAADEEKSLALTFLKLLFSYESQLAGSNEINSSFSIRRDVCKRQFERISKEDMVHIPGEGSFKIGDELDNEKDWNTFSELVEKSTANKSLPKDINNILVDEFSTYFEGGIDRAGLIEHLDNRISLYLNENK